MSQGCLGTYESPIARFRSKLNWNIYNSNGFWFTCYNFVNHVLLSQWMCLGPCPRSPTIMEICKLVLQIENLSYFINVFILLQHIHILIVVCEKFYMCYCDHQKTICHVKFLSLILFQHMENSGCVCRTLLGHWRQLELIIGPTSNNLPVVVPQGSHSKCALS